MKFSEHADIDGYIKSIKVGAAKGAALGFAAGAGLGLYLKQRTNFWANKVGGYQRVFIFVAPAAFCAMVNMEHSSRVFEQQMREKQHGKEIATAARPNTNTETYNKLAEFFAHHKYKVIVAGWASSLAGSFYLVNRDKYLTKAQKLVQARVYAQGLTVAMLLGSVLLSVAEDKDDNQKALEQSNSWERDIKFVETANNPRGVYATPKQKADAERENAKLYE